MDMTDDTSSMSMTSTFQSWSSYQTKILWDGWDIQTQWEFALSWFAVALAAVFYHALRFLIFLVEDYMHPPTSSSIIGGNETLVTSEGYQRANTTDMDPKEEDLPQGMSASSNLRTGNSSSHNVTTKKSGMSSTKKISFRILHATLAGLNYGLALLLMLVAMTYNPSLFMALIIGYGIGDFIFFTRMRPTSLQDCH